MSSIAEAKKELQFNREFTGLVDILKGISASQFQNLMRKKRKFEKFTTSFDGFFKLIDFAQATQKTGSPFVEPQSDVTGVVIATSDEGFMGELNNKVIEAALREAGPGKKKIFVIGTHGYDSLKERGIESTAFPGVEYEKRYDHALAIKNSLVAEVAARKVGRLTITYPYPVSFTVQRPVVVQLLPFAFARTGKAGSSLESGEILLSPETPSNVILESMPEKIIKYLVGMWITFRLNDFFEDSKLAEYAAKTIQLEQSHDRLTEQGKKLRYRYFRARRELIDKGTRETFASILLRRKFESE